MLIYRIVFHVLQFIYLLLTTDNLAQAAVGAVACTPRTFTIIAAVVESGFSACEVMSDGSAHDSVVLLVTDTNLRKAYMVL